MCLETGLTPSGVDTTIPENSGNTERERIEAKTGVAPCLGCHAVINPFGFAFENFDPLGRWRVKEHEFPVNPQVSLDFMGEKDRTVNGPVESLEFFTKSDRFQQCFVRQMFRYYMGRNEVASDDPMLKSMFTALKEKDENLLELLRILASSSRFNQRQ